MNTYKIKFRGTEGEYKEMIWTYQEKKRNNDEVVKLKGKIRAEENWGRGLEKE